MKNKYKKLPANTKKIVSKRQADIGSTGGLSVSKAKVKASAHNGLKGGRPKKG